MNTLEKYFEIKNTKYERTSHLLESIFSLIVAWLCYKSYQATTGVISTLWLLIYLGYFMRMATYLSETMELNVKVKELMYNKQHEKEEKLP